MNSLALQSGQWAGAVLATMGLASDVIVNDLGEAVSRMAYALQFRQYQAGI